MTIHITPEPECSYVSFESNIPARWVSALPMIFRSSAWSQHWPFAFLAPTLILYWGSSTHSNQAQWSFLLLKRQSVWKPKILPELWGKLLLYLIISLVKHMIIWLGNYQCAMSPLITTVIRKIHTHHLCHKNFQGGAIPQWNEEVREAFIFVLAEFVR